MERFFLSGWGLATIALAPIILAMALAVMPTAVGILFAVLAVALVLALMRPAAFTRWRLRLPTLAVICLALLMVTPLGACAAIRQLPNLNAPIAGKTTLDERLLLSAEVAFAAASAAVEAAVDNGLLTGDRARQAKACYAEAHDALLAGRTAYKLTDAAAFLDKVDKAKRLFGQVVTLATSTGQANVRACLGQR